MEKEEACGRQFRLSREGENMTKSISCRKNNHEAGDRDGRAHELGSVRIQTPSWHRGSISDMLISDLSILTEQGTLTNELPILRCHHHQEATEKDQTRLRDILLPSLLLYF